MSERGRGWLFGEDDGDDRKRKPIKIIKKKPIKIIEKKKRKPIKIINIKMKLIKIIEKKEKKTNKNNWEKWKGNQ